MVRLLFFFDKTSFSYNVGLAKLLTIGKCLFIGSVFNFAFNLVSSKVLEKVSAVTHSLINVMKRMYVLFGSVFLLSTRLTFLQFGGIVVADIGCLLYSYLRSMANSSVASVSPAVVPSTTTPCKPVPSNKIARFAKKLIFSLLVSTLMTYYFCETTKTSHATYRMNCIDHVKRDVIEAVKMSMAKKSHVVFIHTVSQHHTYGDTLNW